MFKNEKNRNILCAFILFRKRGTNENNNKLIKNVDMAKIRVLEIPKIEDWIKIIQGNG